VQRTALWICAAALLTCAPARSALAQTSEQESDLPGVMTRVVYLRQYGGALHLGVLFRNTTNRPVNTSDALAFDKVSLVDAKTGRKSFALRDDTNHFLAGPISDWNGGGRWFPTIEAGSQVLVWAIFDPVTASALDVNMPLSQPFDSVPVTAEPPAPGQDVGTAQGPVRALLTSASRANGQLRVRIKLTNNGRTVASGSAIQYADVYVLDPASRKKYGLVKDEDGNYLARPISDKNGGGRLFLAGVHPGGQLFMALTFTAPPDSVKTMEVVVPWLDPFENVTPEGTGGAADTGTAVAGRTIGLERALQDLHADVSPQEVKINLSADVLFDFDKADLKPAAAGQLGELATVLQAYPQAAVKIDGFTDAKGADAYNLSLSAKRAEAVAAWLTAKSGIAASRLQTRGLGKANPVAPNTKPDGSDDPEGRAKNRRVEITIIR
jgi:outer membrane protein OmpA-like peptidoglycan-associated protein